MIATRDGERGRKPEPQATGQGLSNCDYRANCEPRRGLIVLVVLPEVQTAFQKAWKHCRKHPLMPAPSSQSIEPEQRRETDESAVSAMPISVLLAMTVPVCEPAAQIRITVPCSSLRPPWVLIPELLPREEDPYSTLPFSITIEPRAASPPSLQIRNLRAR